MNIEVLAQQIIQAAQANNPMTCAALGIILAHEVIAAPTVTPQAIETDYARGILDAARRQQSEAYQNGYLAGYEAGYADGREDAGDPPDEDDEDDDETLELIPVGYTLTEAGRAALAQASGGAA